MSRSIEQQLRENGFYVSTTVGVSMRPMLRNRRDRVILRAAEPNEHLQKWDLPLYRTADGSYLLHRIIGHTKDGRYIVRGDNTYHKEYVSQDQIVGVMTEFYRGEKNIIATNRAYRCYAAFWNALYPLRKLWLFVRSIGGRLIGKNKKQQQGEPK
jgi:hypothetical protein